jgi:hypothetical protein
LGDETVGCWRYVGLWPASTIEICDIDNFGSVDNIAARENSFVAEILQRKQQALSSAVFVFDVRDQIFNPLSSITCGLSFYLTQSDGFNIAKCESKRRCRQEV